MKLSKLMLAVAALTAGTSAFASVDAANVMLSSGASASKGNYVAALNQLCKTAQNAQVGFTGAAGLVEFTQGSNVSTVVCPSAGTGAFSTGTVAANGVRSIAIAAADPANAEYTALADASYLAIAAGVKEVRINVAGGSFTAMQTLAGGSDNYLNPAVGGALQAATGATGGFMDVSPTCFPGTVQNTAVVPAGTVVESAKINQAFGVAVSPALYNAMFTKQQNPNAGGGSTVVYPIPNACLVTDTDKAECVPTISRGDMAAIMSSSTTATVKTTGASFFGAPANTVLRYVRRVDTSGTQASAQNYFLGLPGLAQAAAAVIPEPTTDQEVGGLKDRLYNSRFRVLAAPGTGDVRTELNKNGAASTGDGENYAIGVVSGENNQSGQAWKWVRVQGAPMGENAAPGTAGNTNQVAITNGSYDFYFESQVAHTPASQTFWTAVIGAIDTQAAPVGLVFKNNMKYARGTAVCKTPSVGS